MPVYQLNLLLLFKNADAVNVHAGNLLLNLLKLHMKALRIFF